MIRLFFSFLCILLGFVSVANAAAPQLKSQSWILVDRLTHTTLANKNADVRTNPGNTVLLMVLYTAEKAINEKIISRTSSITVNNDALSIPPLNAARFYLEPNQSVTVSDLEKAIAGLNSNMNTMDQGTNGIISGTESDLGKVMINMTEAQLSLETAVQVRNKVIEAYNDIKNMQF